MLEPYDGKLSRTVLRRESGGNTADPADQWNGPLHLRGKLPRGLSGVSAQKSALPFSRQGAFSNG